MAIITAICLAIYRRLLLSAATATAPVGHGQRRASAVGQFGGKKPALEIDSSTYLNLAGRNRQ